MVRYISTRIAVMYLGKLVELTSGEELYENPLHSVY
jgi:ABC-type oligopeptide transport system ATPase subunit